MTYLLFASAILPGNGESWQFRRLLSWALSLQPTNGDRVKGLSLLLAKALSDHSCQGGPVREATYVSKMVVAGSQDGCWKPGARQRACTNVS